MRGSRSTTATVTALTVLAASVLIADAQPTVLAESKAWFEGDGLRLMHSVTTQMDRSTRIRQTTDARVTTVSLDDCQLAWHTVAEITTTLGAGERRAESVVDISTPLNDLDVRSVQVHIVPSQNGDATIVVSMKTTAAATIAYSAQGGPTSRVSEAGIRVQTAEDGDTLARALRTAVTLCGAGRSPTAAQPGA
jgi:hypothetical protein